MTNYQEQYEIEIKKLKCLFDHIEDNEYTLELLQGVSVLLSCGIDLQDKRLDRALPKLKSSLWYVAQILGCVEYNLKEKKENK